MNTRDYAIIFSLLFSLIALVAIFYKPSSSRIVLVKATYYEEPRSVWGGYTKVVLKNTGEHLHNVEIYDFGAGRRHFFEDIPAKGTFSVTLAYKATYVEIKFEDGTTEKIEITEYEEGIPEK